MSLFEVMEQARQRALAANKGLNPWSLEARIGHAIAEAIRAWVRSDQGKCKPWVD